MEIKKIKLIKSISRLKKKIFNISKFVFYKNPDTCNNQKTIFINVKDVKQYARYFYIIVKFFHLEGYTIVLPRKYSQFKQIINENLFIKLLLKERIINFKKRDQFKFSIELNEQNLSADYFRFLMSRISDDNQTYHIPMTLFPLMYHKGIWNSPLVNENRKKSIFMIGNFDPNQYNGINKTPFGVHSRIELYETLKHKNELTFFNSFNALKEFINSKEDYKCILIKNSDFKIPIENIRPILSKFSFFLACPGIVMPHSHNLIEAMSSGTIPVIQKKYAEMLHPPLQNTINCIQFADENDLPNALKLAYNLSENKIIELSKNVSTYYNNFLTPRAVVENIENRRNGRFYLLAEHKSVEIYNSNLFNN